MESIEDETARQHSEREQAWLELLENDRINTVTFSELLTMAKQAKCCRVTEYLLDKRKAYDQILNCYILDPYRHVEIWNYIQRYANKPERLIYQQCCENFAKLLEINSKEMTKIAVEYFHSNVNHFIRLLENDQESLYKFIKNLLKYNVSLGTNDCEHYLSLLCLYNPETVETFLRNNECYRLENALEIVKKYQLYDCMIFLYEKQGDYDSAFNLSLDSLKEAPESTAEMRALVLSSLCSRASEVLVEAEREKLWFSLIKTILSRSDLTLITRSILHSASGHVDLTNLVHLVLTSGTKTGNFGDIKQLLVGMLANSKYEKLLIQTTARILGNDLHTLLKKEKRVASRGLSVKSIKCIVCRSRLYNQQDVIAFGLCGHAAHQACVPEVNSTEKRLQCPRCGEVITERSLIPLTKPKSKIFDDIIFENSDSTSELQLEAPPRAIG